MSIGPTFAEEDGSDIDTEEDELRWIRQGELYFDDISGEVLDPKLEMVEVRKHKLYEKVPMKQCYDSTGKAPIGSLKIGCKGN